MSWVFGTILILVFIFIYTNYTKKKRKEKLTKHLLENWGKPKKQESFNFNLIERFFVNNTDQEGVFHVISEKIQRDLDLDELFTYIDRTCSKIGQQYLYYKLRTISSIAKLVKFNSLVEVFRKDVALRIKSQLLLSELRFHSAYDLENLLNGLQVQKSRLVWLAHCLNVGTLLFFGLGFYNPMFFLCIAPIYIVNMYLHITNKRYVNYYLSGVKQLSKALRITKKLATFKDIKEQYKEFSFIKKIDAIQLKTEFLGFETNLLSNEYFFAIWMVIESFKVFLNVEFLVFNSFISGITEEKKSIKAMFVRIGEIDAALSTASLKSDELQTCTPEFVATKTMEVSEIVHPLVNDCVANELAIQDKSILITGSNMSGKTTFIRTIAINSILAQTLYLCFAKTYKAPFLKIYSSIRIADNVLENKSYYLEEVETMKTLLDASTDKAPCLFILDELFKGTNTVERISAGKGILSYLNTTTNIVFVSTHDIELTEMLQAEGYELFHFSEAIANETLVFDHKIKSGRLTTQNAIKILDVYNYPKTIITDAKNVQAKYFGK
ncbi:MutS-related protein [Kordia jejudonensis]|uniref:MutS-related protein n=1 Tax=Kordia jejudonensis TaxID=1348245 RepID=UPI00062951D5|nr:DNA mismatch repair protein MutS [Kordia jejudonensis]